MKTKNEELYLTSDLHLASIINLFFPCVEIHKTADKRSKFAFIQSDDLLDLAEQAVAGRLSVEPFALLNSQKALKRRLYDTN